MHLKNVEITGGKWVLEDNDVLNIVTFNRATIVFNTSKCTLANVYIHNCDVIYAGDNIELQNYHNCKIVNCKLYSAIGYITAGGMFGI